VNQHQSDCVELQPPTRAFYERALVALSDSQVPFLVCGSYALTNYTGIRRHTKDLDVFVRPADFPRALAVLAAAGYSVEIVFSHWLGKVYCADDFLDIIFCSGNGLCPVDDTWFEHAVDGEVLGVHVKFCPPEEIIWQKAFIMERERFDGADVAHLLLARGKDLDWGRLLDRFGPHWRLLLAHLVLFGFIYPGHRSGVPPTVLQELLLRLQEEMQGAAPRERLCQGTLLSRAQYLVDVERWGYKDARLLPHGNMTAAEIQHWTAPIFNELA
jgi:hypothetical protein